LGFVFGSRVAQELNVGLVLFRKEGKIPVEKKTVSFVDYTKIPKKFEVVSDVITPGDKILIVDEWSETGSQLKAAISLVKQCGGIVTGISCFNVDTPVKKDKELLDYKIYSLI
jgi:adenine phosphoribosyltransferase